jgi:oxygen-independent coproporphyrinogen-3 oxidase
VPYTEKVTAYESPSAGSEVLTTDDLRLEEVMLGVRLAEGIALSTVDRAKVEDLVMGGLVDPAAVSNGRVQLTLAGRLLADAVIRDLLGH